MFFLENKERLIVRVAFASILAMLLMPYGSLDPRDVGFWLSIVFGIMVVFGTIWVQSNWFH